MTSCEHTSDGSPYVCARCTAAGRAQTFDRDDDGRERFAEHLETKHGFPKRPQHQRAKR